MGADNDASAADAAQVARASTPIPCVWFFIPLPQPLGLPDGWMSVEPLNPAELLTASQPTSHLRTSLVIHQHETARSYLADMADLYAFAISIMHREEHATPPQAHIEEMARTTGADLETLRTTRTIAEVAVPGVIPTGEEALLDALNAAIEHIRFVQRVVAVATQHAVKLTSRAALPPMVPTFEGNLHETLVHDSEYKLPTIDSSIEWFIPNPAPPAMFGILQESFDDEMMQRVSEAAHRISSLGPFVIYADLRREAQSQMHLGGDRRMALVALASAGEVLLDTALLHMLWEEHTSPPTAAEYFDRSVGHTARVSRHFPNRLGGGWDPGSRTPAGQYLRDLVRLRHRVIHAGHEPSEQELESAWASLIDLEGYLGDRLAHPRNLNRYTRTAVAWMAESGLRRRNRWTKRVRELTKDSREPNWIETFKRWRIHVDRSLDDSAEAPGTDVDALMLYADLLESGDVRWVIHDPTTAHAVVVDPHDVRDTVAIERVADLFRHVEIESLADRRVASPLGRRPPPSATWQRDHEIFPEMSLFPRTKADLRRS